MLKLEKWGIEIGLRLRIIQEIRNHPEIALSEHNLMHKNLSYLFQRLSVSNLLKRFNQMATKIQAFYRAFRTKKAYKLVVSSVLKV